MSEVSVLCLHYPVTPEWHPWPSASSESSKLPASLWHILLDSNYYQVFYRATHAHPSANENSIGIETKRIFQWWQFHTELLGELSLLWLNARLSWVRWRGTSAFYFSIVGIAYVGYPLGLRSRAVKRVNLLIERLTPEMFGNKGPCTSVDVWVSLGDALVK